MNTVVQAIEMFNNTVGNIVWGIPMIVFVLGTGVYLSIRTKFFQIAHLRHLLKETVCAIFIRSSVTKSKDRASISQFQALSTALAATLGTGNISGVATALTLGGPGAVFWMWVSAFFGMMTSFAENVLGIYYRRRNQNGQWIGGPMLYIEKGLRCKPLAVVFALLCVAASFGIGNMAQVNSISTALESAFGIPDLWTGVATAVLVSCVIVGGIGRIGKITEKIVPLMAIGYTLGALVILVLNFGRVPQVLNDIFAQAFGVKSVVGGVSGYAVKQVITMGFKRGISSNEAGMGSGVMVNAASDVREPVAQGMWGAFEVFFDTIVMCSLTALAVLCTDVIGTVDSAGALLDGAPLVIAAFSHGFGGFAGKFVSIAVGLFAFSTLLGWSFYGEKAMEYLCGVKAVVWYKLVFVVSIVIGAVADLQLVWNLSDTLNGMMAIPNLIAVLLLSPTVAAITKNYVCRRLKRKVNRVQPMVSAYADLQTEFAAEVEIERQQQKSKGR